jgi:hypothetical protein
MIYINTKTGAVLETECILKGGDWVAQQPKKEKKKTKAESEE